jgi:hypothetical protein
MTKAKTWTNFTLSKDRDEPEFGDGITESTRHDGLTDLRLTKATLTKMTGQEERQDEMKQRRGQPLYCNRNRDEPEFEETKTWTTFTL